MKASMTLNTTQEVKVISSVKRVNVTYFEFVLDPLSWYQIVSEETIVIAMAPKWFSQGCPPSTPMALAQFVVSPSPIPLIKDTAIAAQVVSQAATTVGVVSSASAAADMQAIAVIGLMSCAQPSGKAALGNIRILAPLAPWESYTGVIVGNVLLPVFVVGLQLFGALILWKVKDLESYTDACAVVRFPALLFATLSLTYQGTGFAAIQLMAFPMSKEEIAAGIFGLLQVLLLPPFLLFIAFRFPNATFCMYDWDKKWPPGWKLRILKLLLPWGRWTPPEQRRRYGHLFSGLQVQPRWFVCWHLLSPTCTVLFSSFRPNSADGCVAQFACLAVMFILFAIANAAIRPSRSFISTFLEIVSAMSIALIAVASAFSARYPNEAALKDMLFGVVQIQIALTFMRLLYALAMTIGEDRLSGSLIPQFHWSSLKPRNTATGEDETGPAEPLLAVMPANDDTVPVTAPAAAPTVAATNELDMLLDSEVPPPPPAAAAIVEQPPQPQVPVNVEAEMTEIVPTAVQRRDVVLDPFEETKEEAEAVAVTSAARLEAILGDAQPAPAIEVKRTYTKGDQTSVALFNEVHRMLQQMSATPHATARGSKLPPLPAPLPTTASSSSQRATSFGDDLL